MPIYSYRNGLTGEERDIVQRMNDTHEYHGENGEEGVWKRLYRPIRAAFGMSVDPNNPKAFIEKTGKQKGTYGDLIEQSKELSEKRAAQHGGIDPVKEKYFKEYSEARNGAKHSEELKRNFSNKNFDVDWD